MRAPEGTKDFIITNVISNDREKSCTPLHANLHGIEDFSFTSHKAIDQIAMNLTPLEVKYCLLDPAVQFR